MPPKRTLRPHLVRRLNDGLEAGRQITLLSAPAGFGKTVCVGDWVSTLDRPAGWLTLDPADDEPQRFFTYFFAALQQAAPGLGAEIAALLAAGQLPPGDVIGSHSSPAMREFLDRVPDKALAGVKVAAFDTRADMDTLNGAMRLFGKFLDRLGYAAPKISSSLETKGGQVVRPPEGFIVKGTEGPLEEGELERAKAWGRQIVSNP